MIAARTSGARGWRRGGAAARGVWERPLGRLLLSARPALALPAEAVLTRAVRRLARSRPDIFERLGEHRRAVFVVQPTDAPVAFRLRPTGADGRVEIVAAADARADAKITGPLATLIRLLDGSFDGDAVFFAREIRIEGDTGAVLALRNALEEAELTLGEVLGLPSPVRAAFDAGLARWLAGADGRRA